MIEHGVLEIVFADGTRGMADMRLFLESGKSAGTVFEALRDPVTFSQATVELGAVAWPGEIDIAPDAMYDAICAGGTWMLD